MEKGGPVPCSVGYKPQSVFFQRRPLATRLLFNCQINCPPHFTVYPKKSEDSFIYSGGGEYSKCSEF